jgi:predicted ester cyclase
MSAEQTIRDLFDAFIAGDLARARTYFTDDALTSGGPFPVPVPVATAMQSQYNTVLAMSDARIEIDSLTQEGDRVTALFHFGGIHSGELNLGLPGRPALPPTGKRVWVEDKYIFTMRGDRIAATQIDSPPNGGLPAILRQLGMQLSG